MPTPYVRAVLTALLVTFLWSTSWLLIKVGLHELPALTFAGLRYGLAFLCLLPIVALPRYRSELRALTRQDVSVLVTLGVVQYALTQGAQFLSLVTLPATSASFVLAFTPALVAVLGHVVLREMLSASQWLALLVVLAGAWVYFDPTTISAGVGWGFGAAVVGVLANATQVLFGRSVGRSRRLSPVVITTLSMGVGAAVLLGAGVTAQGLPILTLTGWGVLGWLAVVNTAVAFTLWNRTQRVLSAVESSLINNTMLVQIALLAVVVLGDTLSVRQVAGIALVLLGSIVVQWNGARQRQEIRPG